MTRIDGVSYQTFGGPEKLAEVLGLITSITSVPKNRIFLFPGNWEHETGFSTEAMNKVIENFGILVFEKYDDYGFVNIEGEKIMVSHFPQHKVPDEFLPPLKFRKRRDFHKPKGRQSFLMDTIEKNIHPTKDTVFEIFAHNHIGGSFVDSKSGKVVINPGVLDSKTKAPNEPRGYALYFQKEKKIVFINFDSNQVMKTVSIENIDPIACYTLLQSI